jgi:hypothetical protein
MAKRFKYNPLTDPHPKRWFKGFVSRAQARHFVGDPQLHKYVGGMRWWTPTRGRRMPLPEKMAALPNRLHPKPRKRRTAK